MFDKLIVSEPEGAEFKNRRSYFMVSSLVVGVLFATAVVISIFASDYGLGTANFELVEMVAPQDMITAEPEPDEPRPERSTAATESNMTTSQANMDRVDQSTLVPESTSVISNSVRERPKYGQYSISRVDSYGPPTSGREPGNTDGSGGLGITSQTSAATERDTETPPPPPVVKPATPAPRRATKGVVNSLATELPKPVYPPPAKSVGAQGQVNVQVLIDEHGRVISANAISGHPMLRATSEAAARRAKFTPTLLSDVPVKVTGVITYNFVR